MRVRHQIPCCYRIRELELISSAAKLSWRHVRGEEGGAMAWQPQSEPGRLQSSSPDSDKIRTGRKTWVHRSRSGWKMPLEGRGQSRSSGATDRKPKRGRWWKHWLLRDGRFA